MAPAERLDDVEQLRAAFNANVRNGCNGLICKIKIWLFNAFWPFVLLVQAVPLSIGALGARVSRQSGRSQLMQFSDQIQLGLQFYIDPVHYYMYRMYEKDNKVRANSFLLHDQMWNIFKVINSGAEASFVTDKSGFNEFCDANNLRHIPVIARITKDVLEFSGLEVRHLPAEDMFAKPARGSNSGRGVLIVRYKSGCYMLDGDIEKYNEKNICQLIKRYGKRNRDYILQPLYKSASAIHDLTGGVLSSFRVLTIRRPGDAVTTEWVVFKIPGQNAIADNFGAGGMAAPVDLKTGKIGSAISLDYNDFPHAFHPETGVQIQGREIPFWREAIELAEQAHRCVNIPLIGWDVGICEDGPVLIEGNHEPAIEILQISHCKGIGGTELGRFMADEVKRKGLI